MKDNLIITFDIDIDVKILLNNNVIGESGYKDTFKTKLEEDGLLTIKHGMKKANIRVSKKQINNISVTYSTNGQLKATFVGATSSNKKVTDKNENNTVDRNVTFENKDDKDNKNEVTVSSKSQGSALGTIMIIIGIFLMVVCFVLIYGEVYIPFLSDFSPIVIPICPILAVTFLSLGINLNKTHNLSEIMKDVELVGKKINEIENLIGEHTSIDITSNGQRLYRWEDYLELLCDKDNVCLEVLKNSIIEQKK